MLVTKKSTMTGNVNTTQDQLDLYNNGGVLIQSVFPNLTQGEREFIKSGTTPSEWKNMFG